MTDPRSELILALDTSTKTGAIVLAESTGAEVTPLASREFKTERSHNSAIFEPLGEFLTLAGSRPINTILAGTGPGSYTGIRIGIASANGLATSINTRAVGVPSALGIAPRVGDFLVVGDARRGNVFHWSILNGIPKGSPTIVPRADLQNIVEQGQLPVYSMDDLATDFEMVTRHPDPLVMTQRYLANRSHWDSQTSIEPVYLAAPFVTTPKKTR